MKTAIKNITMTQLLLQTQENVILIISINYHIHHRNLLFFHKAPVRALF